ncbi:MAG TPA: hypothetical protein PLL10_07865, partial [Elusimicrobiales bacterium]|nr:hypothetical protein [Elusimicrobiales bacterium]
SGKSYRAYLESHIRTVSFGGPYLWMKDMMPDNKKKDAKKDGTVAYVENMVDPSTIWLLKPYAEPDSPMMFRLGVMIHEARHSEGGGWPHVNCPIGSKPSTLVGKPACDTTPYGAYGVGGIFLKNVALHCTNCTDKVREDAALYGNKQLSRIISLKGKQQLREDFGQ